MNKNKKRPGSHTNEPKALAEILRDYLQNTTEPLAVAFRRQHPEFFCNTDCRDGGGNLLFKDIYPNTELGVDLKLLTRRKGRMDIGEVRPGAITRDGEEHFTFVENVIGKKPNEYKRNPHMLELLRINVVRKDDGTLYPTFTRPRYNEKFTFQDFCREAAEELLMVAGKSDYLGLGERGGCR